MRFFEPQVEEQRRPLQPHKVISGNLPGATQIRIGGDSNVVIDGLNKRITITGTSGDSVGIGTIPGTTGFGFFALNSSGQLVQKIVGATRYIYNPSTGADVSQDGLLPDGTVGRADAKSGQSVSGAIT